MPTLYETATQVAGFRPERLAEVSKERRVAQNIKDGFARERQNITKRLRMAVNDPEELKSVQKDMQTYNLRVMKYGGVIPQIGRDTFRAAMKPETGYTKYSQVEERF